MSIVALLLFFFFILVAFFFFSQFNYNQVVFFRFVYVCVCVYLCLRIIE